MNYYFKVFFSTIIIIFGVFYSNNVLNLANTKFLSQIKPQLSKLMIGAYYFDGWADSARYVTQSLNKQYSNRKPKWGWKTSNAETMRKQIDVAANAGLSFFNFCWYFPTGAEKTFPNHPLNQALKLFNKAPNKNRLRFSLLVANHQGSEIGPEDWDVVCAAWISFFKNGNYVKVGGCPYITFFSMDTLVERFGSNEAVKSAFSQFKNRCVLNGLKGVKIAVSVSADEKEVARAKACGFDILTGYNYNSAGYNGSKIIPIDSLRTASYRIWDSYKRYNLPYIPVATLNWDPRPWVSINASLADSPRYLGYSSKSVLDMVLSLKKWVSLNQGHVTSEKIAMLYAWNEYGEGAWLTPSKDDASLLDGVSRGLKYNLKK